MSEKRTLEVMHSNEEFQLSAYRTNRTPVRSIGIFGDIFSRVSTGTNYRADPLTFSKVENAYDTNEEPMCALDKNQAQHLMDTLWSCGIRPAEGEGSAGSMNAVQKHLLDMRKITGHKLGIEL